MQFHPGGRFLIIDIHPHIIASDTARYPLAPLGGHQSEWSQKRPVSIEQMLVAMDKAGVAKSAMVQASTSYGHDNSYVAEAVAKHPDRFTGVFSVDVLAPDAPQKIRYWVGKNLTGLRLFTIGSTMTEQASWLDDPRSYPAWETVGELNIPVCLQMSPKAFPQLMVLLHKFPNVKVILDHLSRPVLNDGPPYAAAEGLFALAKYPTVHLKLTQRNFIESRNGKATLETFFPKLVQAFGANRIAWGSNYPASEGSLGDLVKLAQDSLTMLSANDRDWIFYKTAQSLYPALAK
jgi:L-fuconolactonase